jgi:endonuclease/exonuclease/phosphatase family metal-dependent hydrolase
MILFALMMLLTSGFGAGQQALAASATMPTSAPASEPAEENRWRATVATLNVYFDNQFPDLAVTAIRDSKADVIFLQETTARLEQRLRKELKDSYPHMFFKGGSGRIPTDRFSILSRNPIEKPRFLPPKQGLFGTVIAQTVIDGRRLQLANVHLKPLLLPSNARPAQYLQAFRALDKAHEAEIRYIVQNLDPKLPTILAGDFNSIPGSSAPRLLSEKSFRDAFKPRAEEGTDHDGGPPTWQFDSQLGPVRLRIDYVFYSKELAVRGGDVVRGTGSDHSLVIAELGWADEVTSTKPASAPAGL